ncbi:hypothetical protein R3P38DRAFT_3234739 [Favolaschia claudopus]|uniref:Uncharacterized protein n=1 Tax=Favolaschia claudopus TaxID=2862362 RepID=A0AAV9ZG76_9AGAR
MATSTPLHCNKAQYPPARMDFLREAEFRRRPTSPFLLTPRSTLLNSPSPPLRTRADLRSLRTLTASISPKPADAASKSRIASAPSPHRHLILLTPRSTRYRLDTSLRTHTRVQPEFRHPASHPNGVNFAELARAASKMRGAWKRTFLRVPNITASTMVGDAFLSDSELSCVGEIAAARQLLHLHSPVAPDLHERVYGNYYLSCTPPPAASYAPSRFPPCRDINLPNPLSALRTVHTPPPPIPSTCLPSYLPWSTTFLFVSFSHLIHQYPRFTSTYLPTPWLSPAHPPLQSMPSSPATYPFPAPLLLPPSLGITFFARPPPRVLIAPTYLAVPLITDSLSVQTRNRFFIYRSGALILISFS